MPVPVMIVDDQAIIRRLVREVFEAEKMEVFDAANGAEGIQKAQEVKPGLIILDLSMPVMNGLDAARVLKVGCLRKFTILEQRAANKIPALPSLREVREVEVGWRDCSLTPLVAEFRWSCRSRQPLQVLRLS